MDPKRAQMAEQYRAFGHDPERLVPAQCWLTGCYEYVEVPFVDAAIGRIYCPAHSILRKVLGR